MFDDDPARARSLYKALGASLLLHAAVLAGWRPFDADPPRLAGVESFEVVLTGRPAPRPAPRPARRPAPATLDRTPAATPASAPALAAADAPGTASGSGEALVEARADVAALNNPKPSYPLAARRRGIEGRVLLAAHVRADGSSTEVRLRQSSGHALLDEAALAAVRRWRFIAARRGARAVDSWVDIPVVFRLDR